MFTRFCFLTFVALSNAYLYTPAFLLAREKYFFRIRHELFQFFFQEFSGVALFVVYNFFRLPFRKDVPAFFPAFGS